jgi:hypothetical protein
MKISGVTKRMAERRGIVLVPWDATETEPESVELCWLEDGEPSDEFFARYQIKSEGLFYLGSCLNSPLEDIPHWIPTDAALRGLLDAIGAAAREVY